MDEQAKEAATGQLQWQIGEPGPFRPYIISKGLDNGLFHLMLYPRLQKLAHCLLSTNSIECIHASSPPDCQSTLSYIKFTRATQTICFCSAAGLKLHGPAQESTGPPFTAQTKLGHTIFAVPQQHSFRICHTSHTPSTQQSLQLSQFATYLA